MRKSFIVPLRTAALILGAGAAICVCGYSSDQTSFSANAASKVDLNYLMDKYPEGKYWNHVGMDHNNAEGWTDTPCDHPLIYSNGWWHYVSNGTCNSSGGTMQCWGFVNKLAYECYGTIEHSFWPTTTLDNLKPGDGVRFMNDSHSIFITGVDGEKVTYGECNGDYRTCQIHWNVETTKSEIARTLIAVYSAPSELTVNLANRSVINTDKIKFGSTINVKGNAVGGKHGYQYEFSVQKPGSKKFGIVQKYSEHEYCSYFPWVTGEYKLLVNVKDKDGKTDSKIFTFTVTADAVKNKSSIKNTKLKYGQNAEFTFAAEGGTKGYQYSVTAEKPGGDTVVVRNFAYGKAFSYRPWETGKYKIIISARDSSGNTKKRTFYFTVTADVLLNKTTISDNIISGGDDVLFNFNATGGTGAYKYKIEMKKPLSKEYVILKNYRRASGFKYHPWQEGTYRFRITVKDRTDKTTAVDMITKVTTDPLENHSAVDQSVSYGEDTLMELAASGGAGSYRYKIEAYKPSSDEWVTLRNYSYSANYIYHPWETGKYTIRITVMDSFGKTASKRFNMTVEQEAET